MAKSLAAGLAPASAENKAGEMVPVGDFSLPAIFGKDNAVSVIPRFTTPYLAFAQPAAKEQFATFMRKFPDIEDGDPVMVFPDPEPMLRPSPLRFTVMAAKQYYATRDTNKGGVELERFSKPGPGRVERIFAALIVYLPDVAVPCTCIFKSVKCPCASTVTQEIEKAAGPEWLSGSQAHQMAVAACSEPFARVVGTVSVTTKTGRTSGQPYQVARATCAPSGPVEWKLLAQLLTEDGKKKLEAVAEAYKNRLAELGIK